MLVLLDLVKITLMRRQGEKRFGLKGKLKNVPTASEVTVGELLDLFDGAFSKLAESVAKGEFALWIGSGISRKAPSLGILISLGIEALRLRAVDPATREVFYPKLEEALQMGDGKPEDLRPNYGQPFESWPQYSAIRDRLWNKYSRFLDIRVNTKPPDFMLWEAIDIRNAFADAPPPAAEHLCIAVLVLEGAVRQMASANWDGFIEAAVAQLSDGADGVLQVVVDPNQLRGGGGDARLLKFHGCICHATEEPEVFRSYLTGNHTQIVEWPNKPRFAAMVAEVTGLATSHRSLVMGLSIQDANLQGVFSKAKRTNPWPWPPDPDAPGHVFCEESITEGQQDVLKIVYGENYNDNMEAIESASHVRAWAEQVLIALVLYVLWRKLDFLMRSSLQAVGREMLAEPFSIYLREFRDDLSNLAQIDPADESRTSFVVKAIAAWSRALAIFRTGSLPLTSGFYERVSPSSLPQLPADANAMAVKLGDFAIATALLHQGQVLGFWSLKALQEESLAHGAIGARGAWEGAKMRPLFVVKGAAEALSLKKSGAIADNNAIVIHADTTWSEIADPTGSSRRIRKAPGRTGRTPTRHVSIQKIYEKFEEVDAIMREFVSEISL